MKRTLIPLGPLLGLICAGCSDVGAAEGTDADDAQESGPAATLLQEYGEIPLDRVPQAAKDAALAAVAGLVLETAELEGEGVFCLHGTADGEFYEVEVTADGDVGEIERGDGDKGNDGDEENDGDEDDDGDEEDND